MTFITQNGVLQISFIHVYLHIGVNGKVAGFITYCKVILCQLWFGSVKGHLITSEPALVAI